MHLGDYMWNSYQNPYHELVIMACSHTSLSVQMLAMKMVVAFHCNHIIAGDVADNDMLLTFEHLN